MKTLIANLDKLDRKTTTKLNLVQKGLLEIPSILYEFTNLETLIIRANSLSKLPPEFFRFGQLKKLDIAYNNLTKLPPEIAQLQNLEELNIDHNQISEFPAEIGKLKKLWNIGANNNQIKQLPEAFVRLSSLTTLRIGWNPLTELPANIGELQNLDFLVACYCQLSRLPDSLKKINNLTWLSCNDNPFPKDFDGDRFIFHFPKMRTYSFPKTHSINGKLLCKYLLRIVALMNKVAMNKEQREACYDIIVGHRDKLKKLSRQAFFWPFALHHPIVLDQAWPHIRQLSAASLKEKPIDKNSRIAIVGKLRRLKKKPTIDRLKELGLSYDKKPSEQTTHLVLGTPIKLDSDLYQYEQLVFINEEQFGEWLQQWEEGFLIDEDVADQEDLVGNLRRLLLSCNDDNFRIALELIKTGGFPKELKTEMLIACKTAEHKALRTALRKQLYMHLTEAGRKVLSSSFAFNFNRVSETIATNLIALYDKGNDDFYGRIIATFCVERYQRGQRYLDKYKD